MLCKQLRKTHFNLFHSFNTKRRTHMNEDPLKVLTSSGEIIEPAREVVVGRRCGIPCEPPPLLRYPHVIQVISRRQDALRHHVPQVTHLTR